MTYRFADITFNNSVKAAQQIYGSRPNNERLQTVAGPNDQLVRSEADFADTTPLHVFAEYNQCAPSRFKSLAKLS